MAQSQTPSYYYMRISRWTRWEGSPRQPAMMQLAITDADEHLTHMQQACHVLRTHIVLDVWFPSLL